MKPLVSERTLDPIMRQLEAIFSSPNISLQSHGALTCHPSGHVVGEIAAQKGIPFSRITQQCGSSCDYGCSHGGLVTTLRQDPLFLENVKALCDKLTITGAGREISSCGHVVGHGLGELFANNVIKSLGYCDKLEDSSARHACGQGVMMEHLVGLPDRPKEGDLSIDAVLIFCGSLPDHYKKECFDAVGTYAGRVTQNVDQAKHVCEHVPVASVPSCTQSLGGVVYYQFRHDSAQMSEYCASMGQDLVLPCIRGAIDTNVGEKNRLDYGRALCEFMDGVSREACFTYFGMQVAMAWGSSVRSSICNTLSGEDALACQQ